MATVSPKATEPVKKNLHVSSPVAKQANGSIDVKTASKNTTDAIKSPMKKVISENSKTVVAFPSSNKNSDPSVKIAPSSPRNTASSSTTQSSSPSKVVRSPSSKLFNVPQKTVVTCSMKNSSVVSTSQTSSKPRMDKMGGGDTTLTEFKESGTGFGGDKNKADENLMNGEGSKLVNSPGVVSPEQEKPFIGDKEQENTILSDQSKPFNSDTVQNSENQEQPKPCDEPQEDSKDLNCTDENSSINGDSSLNGISGNSKVEEMVKEKTECVMKPENDVLISETAGKSIAAEDKDAAGTLVVQQDDAKKPSVAENDISSFENGKNIHNGCGEEAGPVVQEKSLENDAKPNDSSFTTVSTPIESPCSDYMTSKDSSFAETILATTDNNHLSDSSVETKEPEVTKLSLRLKIWDHLDKNNLVLFPKPCKGRIPNFVGAPQAAEMLANLDIFKNSKMIKVNPDKPQETVRIHILEHGKGLLVPVPRLRKGLFQRVIPPPEANKTTLKFASQQGGMLKYSRPVNLEDNLHIDMIVLGSVLVDKNGHRIGKGEGFADLEFAMMVKMNAINDDTVIVTTVHDDQVKEELPEHLFKEYDVPVDWIVTPTQIIEVKVKLPRPKGIIWSILSNRRILEMPVLQLLRENEISGGKECTLKEVDSEPEDKPYPTRVAPKRFVSRRRFDYSRSTGDPKRDFQHRYPSNHPAPRDFVNSSRYIPNRPGGGYNRSNGYYYQNGPAYNNQYRQSRSRPPLVNRHPRNRSIPPDASVQRNRQQRDRPISDSQSRSRQRSNAGPSIESTKSSAATPDETINLQEAQSVEVVEINDAASNNKKRAAIKRNKPPIAFSLRIRNIEPGVRVRDLKLVLNERGVKPRDITWRGYKGVALLHFVKVSKNSKKPITIEDIISSLQGITLKPKPKETPQEKFLIVEEAKLSANNKENKDIAHIENPPQISLSA